MASGEPTGSGSHFDQEGNLYSEAEEGTLTVTSPSGKATRRTIAFPADFPFTHTQGIYKGPADDLVLFSYSDRVAQEKLGFYREQRLAA